MSQAWHGRWKERSQRSSVGASFWSSALHLKKPACHSPRSASTMTRSPCLARWRSCSPLALLSIFCTWPLTSVISTVTTTIFLWISIPAHRSEMTCMGQRSFLTSWSVIKQMSAGCETEQMSFACSWPQSSSSGHTLNQRQCRAKGTTQAIGLLTLISEHSIAHFHQHPCRLSDIERQCQKGERDGAHQSPAESREEQERLALICRLRSGRKE